MKSTDILINEHSHILKRLEKAEKLLTNLPSFEKQEFHHFFEFVEEYIDKYHHQKEEGFYFKWMTKRNPSMEHGPIACMLKEHEQGRTLIQSAKTNFKMNKIELFKNNLQSFIDLLRAHIDKENTILYKMADDIDKQTKDGDNILLPAFQNINVNLKGTPQKFGISS